MRLPRRSLVIVAAFVLVACGSSEDSSPATDAPASDPPATDAPATDPPATDPPATTVAPTTLPPTTAPPTTLAPTTVAPTTLPAPTTTLPPIAIGEPDATGVRIVTIDGAALAPLFDTFQDGTDPFYLVHTQQDDIFVSAELYTKFGDEWTGQLGTFPTDCTTHGICVYFDPDGVGPLVGGGPGEGTLTITQLEGGSVITLDDVEISTEDGATYVLSGLTLTG
ncbi:MAG: hypothetical protein HKN44_06735 [Ilumatobacter sp.]|nr:hypothetical protein [Ilumatobacter sp.]